MTIATSADMLATLLTDRRRSESAGFDAYLVKPVDDRVVGKLLLELRNGTAA